MKKANHHESAVSALNKIQNGLGDGLKNEVKEKDAGHYHAILVRIIDRPGQPQNDVRLETQIFNAKAWERVQKTYMTSGFNQVILLHTPDQDAVNIPVIDSNNLEAKIRKEMEAEYQERLAAEKAKLAKKNTVKQDTAKTDMAIVHQDKDYGSEDFVKSLKKADLIDFVKKEKLDVDTNQNAPELLADTLAVLFPQKGETVVKPGTPQAIALELLDNGDDAELAKFVADYGLEVKDEKDAKQLRQAVEDYAKENV